MGRRYYWTIDQWEFEGPYDSVEKALPDDEESEILVQDADDIDWTEEE